MPGKVCTSGGTAFALSSAWRSSSAASSRCASVSTRSSRRVADAVELVEAEQRVPAPQAEVVRVLDPVPAAEEQQRSAVAAGPQLADPADDDVVVAGAVHVVHVAEHG